jgi:hypothetical protein
MCHIYDHICEGMTTASDQDATLDVMVELKTPGYANFQNN